jgi:hypothetical protein
MTAVEELVELIRNFTPEQLKQFLNDPLTLSILQPVAEVESSLPEAI